MYNRTIIMDMPKEDNMPSKVYDDIKNQFINILSENQLSISQTRCLFNGILEQFERFMPVTNHRSR